MIYFFRVPDQIVIAVELQDELQKETRKKLEWLFGGGASLIGSPVDGTFVGPRKEMITPWSTNAVEITQNMGIEGISRIEIARDHYEELVSQLS